MQHSSLFQGFGAGCSLYGAIPVPLTACGLDAPGRLTAASKLKRGVEVWKGAALFARPAVEELGMYLGCRAGALAASGNDAS